MSVVVPIVVRLGLSDIPIDESVFKTLLDNSVASTYAPYNKALTSKLISFADLVDLSRKGEIPYSLFFAPLPYVKQQVETKTKKLLAGISKDTFSIGSRETVELREIELIVKDLLRKQQLIKRIDDSLMDNKIVGMLRKPGVSKEADAKKLSSAIGISLDEIQQCSKKQAALELLIERLEANQILVSRSVRYYMPQRLPSRVCFSGMTIRDKKVPYIFLTGGDHGDHQEPVGRTMFTLTLMAVLVARGMFTPVTWDGASTGPYFGREYDIAGAMLMPTDRITEMNPASLDDIKTASDQFKVTPSAVTVRAMRLKILSAETARSYLDNLRVEFEGRLKSGGGRPIKPENAVQKYNGRTLTSRMISALDAGQMSEVEFCRVVCLNKLKPSQIIDLRGTLQ